MPRQSRAALKKSALNESLEEEVELRRAWSEDDAPDTPEGARKRRSAISACVFHFQWPMHQSVAWLTLWHSETVTHTYTHA